MGASEQVEIVTKRSKKGAKRFCIHALNPPKQRVRELRGLKPPKSGSHLSMLAFLIRRLASMLLVLIAVATLTFFLVRLAPGGPFDRERKIPEAVEKQLKAKYKLDGEEGRQWGENVAVQLGLGETGQQRFGGFFSLLQQYGLYMADLARGDLRLSTKYKNLSVNQILADALPVSAVLGTLAFVIATGLGIPLGTWAAVRQNSWVDGGLMVGALFAISIPTFVTGPLAILVLSLWLGWLPVGGWGTWQNLLMPSVILAAPFIAYIARLMRTSMLEVLSQDFVRTARAKGISEIKIVYKHALKVAILPVISFLGPLAANLLTGSVIVETVFQIPGAGGFFVNAILNRDGFLLGGVVLVYCALLVVMNLLVDIIYTVLDRRIQLNG